MIHIIYRASDSEKLDIRPKFYSKLLCLKSLLFALKKIKDYTFTLYYDGDRGEELIEELNRHIPSSVVIRLALKNNAGSFWCTFQKSLELPDNDWVYFVEDDYLHLDTAIEKLLECIDTIPADYITLYDHPVRYATDYRFGLDIPHRINKIYITKSHHWRIQESTCMTFAAKVKTLKEDRLIFERYVKNRDVPEDRELFRRLQGLFGYEEGSPLRLLIGPIPSLATHCHLSWLAPVINWEEIAKKINHESYFNGPKS